MSQDILAEVESIEYTVEVTAEHANESREIHCGPTYLDALQAVVNYCNESGVTRVESGHADVWHVWRGDRYYNVCIMQYLVLD